MPIQRKIFISYRRADNPDFADRIRDWFINRYGRANVFMDFDTIPPGVMFADYIRLAMQQSDAVVAIIGHRWLDLLKERAAAFEDDYVRIELALALELGKPITPICISGAPVPPRVSLPPDLRSLLDFNIAFLDRTNFYERIERIIASVEVTFDKDQNHTVKVSPADQQRDVNHKIEESVTQLTPPKGALISITEVYPNKVILEDARKSKVTHLDGKDPLSPQDAIAYYNRGVTRQTNGELSGAIADFDQAIRLNPQIVAYHLNRGKAKKDQGDFGGAITDFNEAIHLDPQNATAYYNRGITRQAKGDSSKALADFDQAIRLHPKYTEAYNNRGIARQANGDLAGALEDYSRSIELNNPKIHLPYNNRGAARQANGDLAGALEDYDQAIRLNPEFDKAYNNRGLARQANGDITGALVDYNQAIRLNSQYAKAYYNRGLAHKNSGNTRGAIADCQKYLELGGGQQFGDQAEVEKLIRELHAQLNS